MHAGCPLHGSSPAPQVQQSSLEVVSFQCESKLLGRRPLCERGHDICQPQFLERASFQAYWYWHLSVVLFQVGDLLELHHSGAGARLIRKDDDVPALRIKGRA